MENLDDKKNDTKKPVIAGWIMIIGLMGIVILSLPAYLQTMEIQFLDMEFLSSLCGIAGWGQSGS